MMNKDKMLGRIVPTILLGIMASCSGGTTLLTATDSEAGSESDSGTTAGTSGATTTTGGPEPTSDTTETTDSSTSGTGITTMAACTKAPPCDHEIYDNNNRDTDPWPMPWPDDHHKCDEAGECWIGSYCGDGERDKHVWGENIGEDCDNGSNNEKPNNNEYVKFPDEEKGEPLCFYGCEDQRFCGDGFLDGLHGEICDSINQNDLSCIGTTTNTPCDQQDDPECPCTLPKNCACSLRRLVFISNLSYKGDFRLDDQDNDYYKELDIDAINAIEGENEGHRRANAICAQEALLLKNEFDEPVLANRQFVAMLNSFSVFNNMDNPKQWIDEINAENGSAAPIISLLEGDADAVLRTAYLTSTSNLGSSANKDILGNLAEAPHNYWTGSNSSGVPEIGTPDCADWNDESETGALGSVKEVSSDWYNDVTLGCNNKYRLICIEKID